MSKRPPGWTNDILELFRKNRDKIDTTRGLQKKSDEVLSIIRPDLTNIKFTVEKGKRNEDKIIRPVLFGEMGVFAHKYDIDAFREDDGIMLEVEAGRAIKGNAIYRDLIHMSLMVDAKYAVIAMPLSYKHKGAKSALVEVASYETGKRLLEAIFASQRLTLPFDGILLIGY